MIERNHSHLTFLGAQRRNYSVECQPRLHLLPRRREDVRGGEGGGAGLGLDLIDGLVLPLGLFLG